jgi:hypothetical protein
VGGEKFLQFSRASRFELFARRLDRSAERGDHDVDVIGPAVRGMQHPAPNRTMIGDSFFHEVALLVIERDGAFVHAQNSFELAHPVRRLKAAATLELASLVARQPGTIGSPGGKKGNRH